MKVHVICCNNSIEYAVVEDLEKAESTLSILKDKDIETKRTMYEANNYEVIGYEDIYFWHIHTVEGSQGLQG